ncbi:MAG: M1 family metallopeptidase [Myxococcaceae bacterium]
MAAKVKARATKGSAPKQRGTTNDDTRNPLSRNFRLPTSARPRRYEATLSVDLAQKRFFGQGTLELTFDKPTTELYLHVNGPAILSAKLKVKDETRALTSLEQYTPSETVLLRFEGTPVRGDVTLELEWAAKFAPGLQGLYSAGAVALTQFEAADARRVFPSFDEPSFKARWKLSVRLAQNAVALSNGRIESETVEGDQKLVSFAETPALSSYLIAFVLGEVVGSEVAHVGEIPVRTWSTPDKVKLTRFGQDVATGVLPLLQDYFGLPYAYGKVDQAGVPGFEAGAMENAGLITYRETALLLDPATTALGAQKRVAETITHELAHQWYGNLVTMEWWNDLWLNEAFATWMAAKIMDQWKPEWRIWLEFNAGREDALKLDALRATHPIRGEVRNPAEVSESFDLITYEKGGAILRMIEAYLGEEAFRAGIRRYMKEHQGGNTVADDLWRALAKASKQPVQELADAWIGRGGFPLVELSFQGNTVHLSQSRFYSEKGAKSGELWPVPVVLRYGTEGGVKEKRLILRKAKEKVKLEAPATWVCGNANTSGFYRVAYEANALRTLTQHREDLSPAERAALVSDLWALVSAQRKDVAEFLALAEQLASDDDHIVLDELVSALATLEMELCPEELRPALRERVAQLFAPHFPSVGWDPTPGESDLVRLRRAALLRAAGGVGRSPELVAEARSRIERYLGGEKNALSADVHPPATTRAARAGDDSLFDRLKAALEKEVDPILQRRYLLALASFELPAVAQKGVGLAFDWKVPPQDAGFYFRQLLVNPGAREDAWSRLRKGWTEVQKKVAGPAILRNIVGGFVHLSGKNHLSQAEALVGKNPPPEAKQMSAQTLEKMRQRKALRDSLAKGLRKSLS